MRKSSFAALGVLVLLAAVSAFGQQRLRYDIPFEFHFGDKVVPAGQYGVTWAANNVQHLLSIEGRDSGVHGYAVTFPVGGGTNRPDEGRLVFNKYGDTYFLSEVWAPGYAQGGAISKSKTEREISRISPAAVRVALAAGSSHVIMAKR